MNHHLFQPLLYQVASAGLSPADIATPIREILKGYTSINIIMDEVVDIDKVGHKIAIKSGAELLFENLIVAVGARHSYFGKEEWESIAPGLKSLADALNIRENILRSFELSEVEPDKKKSEALTTFVVIGAGPTGVEMAGAIAEIATKTLTKNFANIDSRESKIYLIEGGNRVLSAFHPDLSLKAKKDLEELGVIVKLDSIVQMITDEGVQIKDDFIASKNIIWAAGNKANSLLLKLDTSVDKSGRVFVENDCSISGHPNIFVIGDAAAFHDGKTYLPGLAPVAAQQGKYVARIIYKKIEKLKRNPFKYIDKGIMATIGKRRAVMQVGKFHMSGFFAWVAWSVVHLLFLVLFRNKISILMSWIYNYFTEQRGARLIK